VPPLSTRVDNPADLDAWTSMWWYRNDVREELAQVE